MSGGQPKRILMVDDVLLFAIPGAWLFFKREKLLTILCLVVVLAHTITIATWHSWEGGLSWGARLMTPIVPVLGLLIAPTLDFAWRKKSFTAAALLVALTGLGVQLAALVRNPTHVMIERVATGEVKYEDTLYTARN